MPEISIEPSPERLGPIDCRELRWWFAVPEVGHRSSSAQYDSDTAEVTGIRRVVSATAVDSAVELVISGEAPEPENGQTFRFLCTLDGQYVRWLAVTIETASGSTTTTASDPGFEQAWGPLGPRQIRTGAGVVTVTVGSRSFTCLRVLESDAIDESHELSEAFVTPAGRTLLYRQYRGRAMDPDWERWRENHAEIEVDGALFLHRDCLGRAHTHLTDAAFV